MKYCFSALLIFLLLAGMKIDACCCFGSRTDDDVDDLAWRDSLAQRKYSHSTDSNNSDGRFSEQSNSPSLKDRKNSFSFFTIYDANFSQEVIKITQESLLSTYDFNDESARCFMRLKYVMDDYDYEGALEETERVRRHALRYLNEREGFFPKNFPESSRRNLVYALQELLQKRYALLNYCMRIVLDTPSASSEFFLHFPDKVSITKNFSENLANLVTQNSATQIPGSLKNHLSKAYTWTTVIVAFSSSPRKKSYLERFCKMLTRVKN